LGKHLLSLGFYDRAPDPEIRRTVEFCRSGCGPVLKKGVLPPGHPITYNIESDIDKRKQKYLKDNVKND
jgi:acetone carboxylase gamma subunit